MSKKKMPMSDHVLKGYQAQRSAIAEAKKNAEKSQQRFKVEKGAVLGEKGWHVIDTRYDESISDMYKEKRDAETIAKRLNARYKPLPASAPWWMHQ